MLFSKPEKSFTFATFTVTITKNRRRKTRGRLNLCCSKQRSYWIHWGSLPTIWKTCFSCEGLSSRLRPLYSEGPDSKWNSWANHSLAREDEKKKLHAACWNFANIGSTEHHASSCKCFHCSSPLFDKSLTTQFLLYR